jgi:hypothetical protein
MCYTPLDSEREIRVLRIRSRSFSVHASSAHPDEDVPIHCDLYTVKREGKPDYDALSYVWGDDKETLPILVNYTDDKDALPVLVNYTDVQVTRNLRVALEHLRDDTLDVNLWVDALCINQKRTKEKSAQLKKMRDVYAYARRTRVWLGPTESNSDQAIIKLTEIGKAVVDRRAFDAMIRMTLLSSENPDEAYDAEMQVRGLVGDMLKNSAIEQAESYHLLTELGCLLSRSYWERVWILQEIAVSREVEVHCGKSKIDFALLHAALLYIIYMQVYVRKDLFDKLNVALDAAANAGEFDPHYDPELLRQFQEMGSIDIPESAKLVFGMRQGYQKPTKKDDEIGLDLIRLLAKIRIGRAATDPRDRIYALLGMAADAKRLDIVPDYDEKNSCIGLYRKTARAIIASGQVDLLSFSQTNKVKDGVPSWVLDWREEVMEPCGLLPWDTPYYASGKMVVGTFKKHPDFDSAPLEHLVLNGYRIDSVDLMKDQCNGGKYLEMVNRSAAAEYIKDIHTLCNISNEKLNQTGEIYSNPSARILAPVFVPVADMFVKGFFRIATIEECKLGWEEVIKDYIGWKNGRPLPEKTITMQSYYNMMARQVSRRPFVTTKGYVGLAPNHVQEKDVVVIFQGGKFPYTLRKNDNGRYELIGETYLHGVMYGEFINSDMKVEKFCLE